MHIRPQVHVAHFSLKIEYNLVLTKVVICQIALLQSTHDLNSIGYKRCYVKYDTFHPKELRICRMVKELSPKRGNYSLFLN